MPEYLGDSLLDSTLLASCTELSLKQWDILQKLNAVIFTYGIKIEINKPLPKDTALYSLDIEHDESGGFVGAGLYHASSNCVYYYNDIVSLRNIDFSTLSLVTHNGKTDLECLRTWGINVDHSNNFWDVYLYAHIIDSTQLSYGLKSLSKRQLGIEYPDYDDIVGKRGLKATRITLDAQPTEIVAKYNTMDCYVTYKLYEKQSDKNSPYPGISHFFDALEKPASLVFQSMENRGIMIDVDYLKALKNELEGAQKPIKEEILNQLGPINLNSPKQLLEALHAKGIRPEFKGKSSTDKRALAALSGNGLVSNLLAYSELSTLLSSFVDAYLERQTCVVHPFFNQCGTRTGRPSCSNPNLLQIPKRTENGQKVRRMFIPRPGMLLGDCDFGQIEPRVLAHLSKDEDLCRLFTDNVDFHTFTAENLGIGRDRAKVLNLSVGYRATRYSVQRQLGGTLDEAQDQIDAWWALFPKLRRWQDSLIFDAKKSGFVTTLYGRRIKVDGLENTNPYIREAAERQVINNIAQSSAAEIMKLAMIKCHNDKRLSKSFGILIQVYDQLVAESYDMYNDITIMVDNMEHAVKLDIPLTVDYKIGPNWAEVE